LNSQSVGKQVPPAQTVPTGQAASEAHAAPASSEKPGKHNPPTQTPEAQTLPHKPQFCGS
jgi:hypothetical protein